MPLDNSISNILGTKIPYWLWQQFQIRSQKTAASGKRDDEVIKYIANKTAWVRLVSSIDITGDDLRYFQKINPEIAKGDDLAKQYVLFGGTSKYLGNNSYGLRSGFSGMDSNAPYGSAYGIMGKVGENDEVAKYGYRPMPGITNVSIETQGKLGSVRAATVNFKCWTKDQLDIMDALYFKLGFTMFLEWGQTYYFAGPPNDPSKLMTTELKSIDPFSEQYRGNKELMYRTIAKNNRETEGNYDAMLGIVTNFTFSFNQEGGYDCTLKLISLGILGDSIKVNNSSKLIDILSEQVKQYEDVLKLIEESKPKEPEPELPQPPRPTVLEKFVSSGKGDTGKDNTKTFAGILSKSPEDELIYTENFGNVLYIKKLNRFLTTDLEKFPVTSVKLDLKKIKSQLAQSWIKLREKESWERGGVFDATLISFQRRYLSSVPQAATKTDTPKKRDFYVRIQAPKLFLQSSQEPSIEDVDFESYVEKRVSANYALPEEYNTQPGFSDRGVRIVPSGSVYMRNGTVNLENTPQYYESIYKGINEGFFTSDFESFDLSEIDMSGEGNNPTFTIKSSIKVTLPSRIDVAGLIVIGENVLGATSSFGGSAKDELEVTFENVPVTFEVPITFSFQETDFIKEFQTEDIIERLQPPVVPKPEEPKTEETPDAQQTENPFSYLSNLELSLKSIQVHSLVEALKSAGQIQTGDIDILSVVKVNLDAKQGEGAPTFAEQIFSNGIFTEYFRKLMEGQIGDELTNNPKEDLKVYAKYGFATKLLGNLAPVKEFKPVDYGALMNTYVLPYRINQVLESGTQVNFPVYIQFGTLLMLLNHSCTMYDVQDQISTDQEANLGLSGLQRSLANAATAAGVIARESQNSGKKQTPMIYIDYNPNHSFCLTSPLQMSTDPFTAMIPFNGNIAQYARLFDPKVLTDDGTYRIRPVTGSARPTYLLRPADANTKQKDAISPFIPKFVDQGSANRGRIMDILINIDYLNETVKQYAKKDTENKVFLKPLLEQIISDINKSIGNFNVFRLAYNDTGNTFHIVDDQIIPVSDQNEQQLYSVRQKGDDPTDLPIFGRFGIATKNLEIRTDVSSKLSNMIAVSANPETKQGENSTDGSTFGFINYNYTDRYIPQRGELPAGEGGVNLNGEIATATQFNDAMLNFYARGVLDQNSVETATNYYIDKLTKKKSEDSATRAAAMIPVSLNFTTDGISGLYMGQAFTVDKSLLPYTYSLKKFNNESSDNKVGFVITGISHTIDANVWSTSVKTNMIFLKKKEDYEEVSLESSAPTPQISRVPEEVQATPQVVPLPVSQNVDANLSAIKKALISLGVTNRQVIIATLANAMKESGGLVKEENTNYSRTKPERIREIFGSRVKNLTDQQIIDLTKNKYEFVETIYGVKSGQVGKNLGNNQPGDGNKYIGRGFIQLTGKSNYARYSNKWFKDDRLVKDPTKLNTVEAAAGTSAAFIQDQMPRKAKAMGLTEKIANNTITQEEANLLITSVIGGKTLNRKNLGEYFTELMIKVDGYSVTIAKKYDKL